MFPTVVKLSSFWFAINVLDKSNVSKSLFESCKFDNFAD